MSNNEKMREGLVGFACFCDLYKYIRSQAAVDCMDFRSDLRWAYYEKLFNFLFQASYYNAYCHETMCPRSWRRDNSYFP